MWLLAACPQKRASGPVAESGAGCPPAAGVYVASYIAPEDTEGGMKQGHSGWVLPLHVKRADSIAGIAEYAAIDAAAASAAGVPAPPKVVWMLSLDGAPCKAQIGGYYAAALDRPAQVMYGVELTGCPVPRDPSDASAIAVTYDADAGAPACKVIPPRPVAARLGEMNEQGQWQRPAKETPIPPAFAALVPEKPCAAPACEKLWSIAQFDVGGAPVAWAGAVNWLAIPAGEGPETGGAGKLQDGKPTGKQCAWKAETFSGFFVAGPGGAAVQVPTEGRPLPLSAVLADSAGAKALIAIGPGEYTAYDFGAGTARVGRHLEWLIPDSDSGMAVDQLGPDCGM